MNLTEVLPQIHDLHFSDDDVGYYFVNVWCTATKP